MKRWFQDTKTGEVIEVPEVRPGLVNLHGCLLDMSELRLYNWEEISQMTKNTQTPSELSAYMINRKGLKEANSDATRNRQTGTVNRIKNRINH